MDCVFTRLSQCRALVVTISVSITTGDCSTGDGSFRIAKKNPRHQVAIRSHCECGESSFPPVWDHLSKYIHWDQNLRVEETSIPKVLCLAILYHYVVPSRAWNLCFKRTNCVAVVHVIYWFHTQPYANKSPQNSFHRGIVSTVYVHTWMHKRGKLRLGLYTYQILQLCWKCFCSGLHMTLEGRDTKLWPTFSGCITMASLYPQGQSQQTRLDFWGIDMSRLHGLGFGCRNVSIVDSWRHMTQLECRDTKFWPVGFSSFGASQCLYLLLRESAGEREEPEREREREREREFFSFFFSWRWCCEGVSVAGIFCYQEKAYNVVTPILLAASGLHQHTESSLLVLVSLLLPGALHISFIIVVVVQQTLLSAISLHSRCFLQQHRSRLLWVFLTHPFCPSNPRKPRT